MGLGRQPAPLTAIATGVLGGLERREKREESERTAALQERQVGLQERKFGLQEQQDVRAKRRADLELFQGNLQQVAALALRDPDQANQLIANLEADSDIQRIRADNNLENIALEALAQGGLKTSGSLPVTEKNKAFLEAIGSQSTGSPVSLDVDDVVDFSSQPGEQSFEVKKGLGREGIIKLAKVAKAELDFKQSQENLRADFLPDQQKTIDTKFSKMEKGDRFKASSEQLSAASSARTLLNAKNAVADAAIPRFLAKQSGEVGVLTDKDVADFGGLQSYWAKLRRFWERGSTSLLPDEDRAEMLEMVTILETKARDALKREHDFTKFSLDNINSIKGKSIDSLFNQSVLRFDFKTLEQIDPDLAKSVRETKPGEGRKIQPTAKEQQAIDFLRNNPNHPDAAELREDLQKAGLI